MTRVTGEMDFWRGSNEGSFWLSPLTQHNHGGEFEYGPRERSESPEKDSGFGGVKGVEQGGHREYAWESLRSKLSQNSRVVESIKCRLHT